MLERCSFAMPSLLAAAREPVMAGPVPVAIIMGSQSDWATMREAAETLDALGVRYDARIVSALRTPDRLVSFAKSAKAEGFQVVIAGAGAELAVYPATRVVSALPHSDLLLLAAALPPGTVHALPVSPYPARVGGIE